MRTLSRSGVGFFAGSLTAFAAFGQAPVKLSNFGGGAISPSPRGLATIGARLIFSTSEFGDAGRIGLWRSDGTPLSTVRFAPQITMVTDGLGDPGDSDPRPGPVSAGQLVFFVGTENGQAPAGPTALYRTDGTPEGTFVLRQFTDPGGTFTISPSQLCPVGDTLYFAVQSALWKSDGTAAGTQLVIDLADPMFSRLRGLTNLNGTLLFFTSDVAAENVRGLWRSNGTPGTTQRLVAGLSIDQQSEPGFPSGVKRPVVAGNRAFFSASLQGGPLPAGALWTSDGTPAGSFEVASFPLSGTGSSPRGFTVVGDSAYFIVGNALWRTIGSPPLAAIVRDLTSPDLPIIAPLSTLDNRVIFSLNAGTLSTVAGLWRSEGSSPTTVRYAPNVFIDYSNSDPTNSGSKRPATVDGYLYFSGTTDPAAAGGSAGLWRTDGTLTGTVEVARFNDPFLPGSSSPDSYTPTSTGRRLYFRAGADVYVFDTQTCRADFNGDGTVDPDDLSDFIALYFSPCP
jgi:ELWxxDGT repeat protein